MKSNKIDQRHATKGETTRRNAKQLIVTKPRLRHSYVMTVIKHDPLGIDACTKDVNYQIFEPYNVFGT